MTLPKQLITAILCASIGCTAIHFALATENEPEPLKLLRITSTVDQREVRVGQTVIVTESVPSQLEPAVTSMRHHTILIGKWNKKSKEFTLENHQNYRLTDAPWEDGLSTLMFSHPNGLEKMSPEPGEKIPRKGIQFKFKPKKPGIYLLTSEWKNRKSSEEIWVSNPFILIVRGE